MAKKLLVADDSLTIQKVIKLALSGDGYEIQTVSDGTECLQQAALFRPDVILIDIGLPGRSAFDLKKAANEDPDLAKIPFVLMSSAFEKVDEAKVALLRFDGRLTKPFDPSNLKTVLLDALKMNSGQAVREFAPPPPPSLSRGSDSRSEVTGDIQLMDPNLMIPTDPLWNDSAMNEPLSIEPHQGEDSDIRHLTESTVKMSSLDELSSWNIAETSKGPLPPIPSLFSNPKSDTTHHRIELPAGPPRPPAPTPPATPSTFSNEPGTRSLSMQFQTQETRTPTPSADGGGTLEALVEKQVREQLEIMVQGAVKTQLEQMARKALPEIAERVVKAEIRKMLEGLGD